MEVVGGLLVGETAEIATFQDAAPRLGQPVDGLAQVGDALFVGHHLVVALGLMGARKEVGIVAPCLVVAQQVQTVVACQGVEIARCDSDLPVCLLPSFPHVGEHLADSVARLVVAAKKGHGIEEQPLVIIVIQLFHGVHHRLVSFPVEHIAKVVSFREMAKFLCIIFAFLQLKGKYYTKYLRNSMKMLTFATVQWNEGLDKSSSFLL